MILFVSPARPARPSPPGPAVWTGRWGEPHACPPRFSRGLPTCPEVLFRGLSRCCLSGNVLYVGGIVQVDWLPRHKATRAALTLRLLPDLEVLACQTGGRCASAYVALRRTGPSLRVNVFRLTSKDLSCTSVSPPPNFPSPYVSRLTTPEPSAYFRLTSNHTGTLCVLSSYV